MAMKKLVEFAQGEQIRRLKEDETPKECQVCFACLSCPIYGDPCDAEIYFDLFNGRKPSQTSIDKHSKRMNQE